MFHLFALLVILFSSATCQRDLCLRDSTVLLEELGISKVQNNSSCNSSLCNRNVRMTYINFPPYALRLDKEDDDQGLLQVLSADIFESCCPSCSKSSWHKVATGELNLSDLAREGDGDIFFPAFGSTTDTKVRGINFLPLIPIPLTMLIYIKDESAKALTSKLISSCLEIWPLIVISLMLALFSGVIVWLLDTWFNVDEFPRPFFKGSLEGFWWAFVSMTTVGYGDRSPKSILARAFAVIWILTGITIISMVTASMTSSITSVLVDGPPSLTGEKIGVLKENIFEKQEVVKQNAIIQTFTSMTLARDALIKEEIKGIIVDNYAGLYYLGMLFRNIDGVKAYSYKTARDNSAYGLLIPDDELYEFCKSFTEYNKELIDLAVMLFFKNKPRKTQTAISLNSLFSTSSGFFSFGLMVGGILLGLFLILGIVFELLRRSNLAFNKVKASKQDTNGNYPTGTQIEIEEMDAFKSSLRDAEISMQGNVNELIKKWESLIPKGTSKYIEEGQKS